MIATPSNWPLLSLLRFALSLVVFAAHPPIVFEGGPDVGRFVGPVSAVAGFFVISGFSIGHSLKRGSAGFYARRFKRIYPEVLAAFIVAAVAFAIVGEVIFPAPTEIELTNAEGLAGVWIFLRNLVPLWCVAFDAPTWNPPFWSLGIEVAYYAAAPLLLRLKPRAIWFVLLASLALNLAVAAGHVEFLAWRVWGLWLAWLWLAGYLLAVAPSPGVFAIVGLSPVLWQLLQTIWHAGNAAALTLTVFVLAAQDEMKLPASWHKAATQAGDFSYTLYALHVPVWLLLVALGVSDWRVALPVSLAIICGAHLGIEAWKVK